MYIRLYGSRDVIIARAQPPLIGLLDECKRRIYLSCTMRMKQGRSKVTRKHRISAEPVCAILLRGKRACVLLASEASLPSRTNGAIFMLYIYI